MRTPDATWLELRQKDKFSSFYQGLREYLKSKLSLIGAEGSYSYYTCGHHHDHSDPTWKPFKHLERYCEKKGFDFYEAKDMVEKHIGKKIICECQIISDKKAIKRARLQKAFGLDFGEPGRETCGLSEDEEKR